MPIHELLRRIMRVERITLGRAVTLNEDIQWEGGIRGSATKIEQIVLNPMSNAAYAARTSGGGDLIPTDPREIPRVWGNPPAGSRHPIGTVSGNRTLHVGVPQSTSPARRRGRRDKDRGPQTPTSIRPQPDTDEPMMRTPGLKLAAAAGILALTACGGDGGGTITNPTTGEDVCSLDQSLLWASLPPDAIPALTLPEMVHTVDPEAEYLINSDRVLGIVVNGEARAYPHNILWWHEIINDRIDDTWVSVSFCPLTGSGLAFSPVVDGNRLDLGVSGLLFANNLVMYDRLSGSVYGPQLDVDGKCTKFRSTTLDLIPVQEMSYGSWKQLHPDTKVVTGLTGFSRNYRQYPYGSYDRINNGDLNFPMPVDNSRAIKERVLAIRDGADGGRGYPFGELAALGDRVAVNEVVARGPVTVFYESDAGERAVAYGATVDGRTLTFTAGPSGGFVDHETGTVWSFAGEALDGPLAGKRLEPIAEAYVLFWFAWRHFQPDGTTFVA